MDRPVPPAVLDPLGAACARAAGVAGIAANGLLAGFFAARAASWPAGELLGPANDLVGSLASALMIPVAVSVRPLLASGRSVETVQALGLASMGVLAVSGPLLVLGVVPFEVSTAITLSAAMVLAGWLLGVNRWMRRRRTLPPALARLGEVVGAATLAAGAGAAAGWLLLPRGSTAQVVVLVAAGIPGVLAWLATPVWFLRLGHRPADVPASAVRPMQGAQS
jgi:hypothetical protein